MAAGAGWVKSLVRRLKSFEGEWGCCVKKIAESSRIVGCACGGEAQRKESKRAPAHADPDRRY